MEVVQNELKQSIICIYYTINFILKCLHISIRLFLIRGWIAGLISPCFSPLSYFCAQVICKDWEQINLALCSEDTRGARRTAGGSRLTRLASRLTNPRDILVPANMLEWIIGDSAQDCS